MAKKQQKKEKAKKVKDANAPKKNLSPYFLYNQERRETLKKEKPDLNNKELIKVMSAEWNELSDEQKKKYVQKAEADKKRYEKEKAEYEKKKAKAGK